jgi:hypothetical protein
MHDEIIRKVVEGVQVSSSWPHIGSNFKPWEVLPHTPLGMQSLVSLGTANKQQDGRAPPNPNKWIPCAQVQ